MNRKREQSVTIDDRRTSTKVLGADKDKVHRDQTQRYNNKDAMFDWKSGFHRNEDKRNFHVYVTTIMIITFIVFVQTENIITCYFSTCATSFVAVVCIFIYLHVVQECLCGIK